MSVDNSALVAQFCPPTDDGDTFIYTEMLDRTKRKGNNGVRLLKAFYHRSADEFREQWPDIRRLCDIAKVRACTRLAHRSYRSVGREFTKLVVDASLSGNWQGMKTLYARAAGTTAPIERRWLFDVDAIDERSGKLQRDLTDLGVLMAVVPSRRAHHLIAKPFNLTTLFDHVPADGQVLPNVQLHRDNPTNLYIPDEAA